MNPNMYEDYFGFLRYEKEIDLGDIKITSVPYYAKYAKLIDALEELSKPTRRFSPQWEYIPEIKNIGDLYRIQRSHRFEITGDDLGIEFREKIGNFIIYLLSYLFGTRLQFHDWWLDLNWPITKQNDIHMPIDNKVVVHFLNHCINEWYKLNEVQKRWIINILFMHTRASSYTHEWETFANEYMVTDACWAYGEDLGKLENNSGRKNMPHGLKMLELFNQLGLYENKELREEIIELRNNLFHQSLWGKSNIPCSPKGPDPFYRTLELRKINHRIIAAILGYQNRYTKSDWTKLHSWGFDNPNESPKPGFY